MSLGFDSSFRLLLQAAEIQKGYNLHADESCWS